MKSMNKQEAHEVLCSTGLASLVIIY